MLNNYPVSLFPSLTQQHHTITTTTWYRLASNPAVDLFMHVTGTVRGQLERQGLHIFLDARLEAPWRRVTPSPPTQLDASVTPPASTQLRLRSVDIGLDSSALVNPSRCSSNLNKYKHCPTIPEIRTKKIFLSGLIFSIYHITHPILELEVLWFILSVLTISMLPIRGPLHAGPFG